MWLSWYVDLECVDCIIVYHERLTMLRKKEADLCRSSGVPQKFHVTDNLFYIQELERFQRAPDLFPRARQIGLVEDINIVLSRLVTRTSTPSRS